MVGIVVDKAAETAEKLEALEWMEDKLTIEARAEFEIYRVDPNLPFHMDVPPRGPTYVEDLIAHCNKQRSELFGL